jgi:hypothetical protein
MTLGLVVGAGRHYDQHLGGNANAGPCRKWLTLQSFSKSWAGAIFDWERLSKKVHSRSNISFDPDKCYGM